MLARCTNPQHINYKTYGGRGITVCVAWRDMQTFFTWAEENGWKPGLQLDRINNAKGYSPANCRIVDRRENNRNKRIHRRVAAFGESKLLCEWYEDERCLVHADCLRWRLNHGWDAAVAMTTPSKRSG